MENREKGWTVQHEENSTGPARNRLIEIDKIDPSRELYSEEDVSSLANSIKKHGFLQPIGVHEINYRFGIVYGNTRYYAAKQAGLKDIPCIVIAKLSEKEQAMINAVENFQRKVENPIIRAKTIKKLIELGHKPLEIAEELNLDKSTISRLLQLLKLHTDIQEAVAQDKIDYRRAADLARITDLDKQLEVYTMLPRDKEGKVTASRSQTRNRVNSVLNKKASRAKKTATSIEDEVRRLLEKIQRKIESSEDLRCRNHEKSEVILVWECCKELVLRNNLSKRNEDGIV